ncbi:hypothetical protein HQ40_01995 [Porphyromonas gulae]|uniref:hypothetical protein n=1 Tax=Porphyromonas gulae TaxID=111105 RepID=UPI00052C7764|nr:hypothetical protein [Porphyromonas gulae]KGN76892.1 hypothetical protein HQ40_01995 [Porphyromonas gulae]
MTPPKKYDPKNKKNTPHRHTPTDLSRLAHLKGSKGRLNTALPLPENTAPALSLFNKWQKESNALITVKYRTHYVAIQLVTCLHMSNLCQIFAASKRHNKQRKMKKMKKMEKMKKFSDYCRDYICDRIHDHVGRVLYTCDIAHEITLSANIDGSATYSASKASEYLKCWWDDCSEFERYCKETYGECRWSAFTDSEKYMVCMIIAGVESLLNQCETIQSQETLQITSDIADKIIDELNGKNVNF